MKIGALALLAAIPASLLAQTPRDIPQGNPLGDAATSAGLAQAQAAERRDRLQAAARARANAQAMADAFAPSAPVGIDEGRTRSTPSASSYGQTAGSADVAARAAPSPYGGYYQIRTPWDRR